MCNSIEHKPVSVKIIELTSLFVKVFYPDTNLLKDTYRLYIDLFVRVEEIQGILSGKVGPDFQKSSNGCSTVTEGQVSSTEVRCRSVSHGKLSTADITSSKVRAAMASNSPFSYSLYCSFEIRLVIQLGIARHFISIQMERF